MTNILVLIVPSLLGKTSREFLNELASSQSFPTMLSNLEDTNTKHFHTNYAKWAISCFAV